MRFSTCLCLLGAVTLLCTPLAGQCTAMPYTEDFEATTPLTTSCGTVGGTTYPGAWTIDPTSTNNWNADVGGTGSTNTGPSTDFFPGTSTGIYLYTETSGCGVGTQAILNSPIYDVTALTAPTVVFHYHMYGATMGTLALEVWDGMAWVPTWSMTGDQGDQWSQVTVPLLAYPETGCTASKFRFIGTSGSSFTSDMALDMVIVGDPPVPQWELNDATSSLSIDGVAANQLFAAAIVNKTAYSCAGGTPPVSSTWTLSSNLPGFPFDIVTSAAPLVSATGGGLTLTDGQVVNIDIFQPFVLLGGGQTLFLPGTLFPGVTDVTITMVTSSTTASTLSAQAVVIDPMAPLGYKLSQGNELNLAVSPPPTTIPGPTTVTGLVTVDVTNAPTCWVPGGIPFYGTTFNSMTVFSGGTIQFGGTDTDTTPSIADATTDDGRVGFWTSMDPSEGGTITISNPMPNLLRVDWSGVWYDAGGPGNTFGIQIDCTTGVIQIDGLSGLMPNPNTTSTTDDQWLGISPGISISGLTATDPGAAMFGLGASGFAGAVGDMLYEFNDVSVTLAGLPASVSGGMNTLVFSPTGVGMGVNYSWAGM